MTQRRKFLRDIAIMFAISLLPKVLRPSVAEVMEEEEEVEVTVKYIIFEPSKLATPALYDFTNYEMRVETKQEKRKIKLFKSTIEWLEYETKQKELKKKVFG